MVVPITEWTGIVTIPDREDFFDVIKDLAMQLIVAALLDLKR